MEKLSNSSGAATKRKDIFYIYTLKGSFSERCSICILRGDQNFEIPPLFILKLTSDKFQVEGDEHFPQMVCVPCFKTVRIAFNFIKNYKESRQKLQEMFLPKNEEEVEILQHFDDCNTIEVVIDEKFNDISEDAQVEHPKPIFDEVNLEKASKIFLSSSISDQKVMPKKQGKGQKIVCPNCPKSVVFQNYQSTFTAHVVTCHSDEIFKCNLCDEDNLNVDMYLKHFADTHLYQCQHCGKSFRCVSSKNAHLKTHSSVRYRCNFENCYRSFVNSWYLKKHINRHTKDVKFNCSQCSYKTCSYDSFQYHIRKHKGKKFLCPHCGQVFMLAVHLKYHMWKHTGDKYFKCKLCPKSYTSSSQLKKHTQREHVKTEDFLIDCNE